MVHFYLKTYNKGFLLGGYSYNQNDIERGYLVKTDSVGTQEWERFYTSPTGYDNFPISGITVLNDTSYLLSTALTTNSLGNPFNLLRKARIIKLRKDFSQKWSKLYGEELFINGFGKATQINSGNIIILGQLQYNNQYSVATLSKIDTAGTLIWSRNIFYSDSLCENYGESFTTTNDGGFAIGGWVSNSLVSPTQQLWIAKLDSNGCDGIHFCDTITFHHYFSVSDNNIIIFPNPVRDVLHIVTHESKILKFFIENLQGQKLYSENINSNTVEIYISRYPQGIYNIKLITSKGLIIKKIIKI